MIEAIKTLQSPSLIDPLSKQSFDDLIVEAMQKQRMSTLQKKSSFVGSKIDEDIGYEQQKDVGQRSANKLQSQVKWRLKKARDEQDKAESAKQAKAAPAAKGGSDEGEKSPIRGSQV